MDERVQWMSVYSGRLDGEKKKKNYVGYCVKYINHENTVNFTMDTCSKASEAKVKEK